MGPAGQLESSESRKLFHGASVITTFNSLLWKVSPKVSPDPMSQLRNRKRSLVTARRDTQADLLAEHHEDKKHLAAMKGPATEVMQMTVGAVSEQDMERGIWVCPWIGSSAEDCAEDK